MENLKELIQHKASIYSSEFREVRRYLHTHPELSEQERNTAAFIKGKLDEYGIEYKADVGGYGIVGEIMGKDPDSYMIALRADMDALPILEENETVYSSCNPGVMHACGHDVHMTCLLGASKIINELRNELKGTIRLVFQPSEEKFPGGALAMIKEGVLENPRPSRIIGLHTLPTLDAGKVGMKPGKSMASTDEIYLTVKGKGGHGATPDLNVDTVLIASHLVVALQQLVSRMAPPNIPTVLSFGRFIANGMTNIIPDEVKIDGTFRTFDEDWRANAHKKIINLATHLAESMGGSCDVFIDKGYPFLINDELVTAEVKQLSQEYLDHHHVVDLEARMTAEDFAYYSHLVPACFFRLGVKNPVWENVRNLHTSTFDIDERCIDTGVGLMAWLGLTQKVKSSTRGNE